MSIGVGICHAWPFHNKCLANIHTWIAVHHIRDEPARARREEGSVVSLLLLIHLYHPYTAQLVFAVACGFVIGVGFFDVRPGFW